MKASVTTYQEICFANDDLDIDTTVDIGSSCSWGTRGKFFDVSLHANDHQLELTLDEGQLRELTKACLGALRKERARKTEKLAGVL